MLAYADIITRNRGFTLMELLVTIAIVALVMAMGIPSLTGSIRNSQLTTQINEVVGAMNFARSEALKRNKRVTVRKSYSKWEKGWTVFIDVNGDGTQQSGDTVLRVYGALPDNFTLRTTRINRVTYQASGASGNSSFVLCDNSDGNNLPEANTSRLMIINNVGRVRMGADSNDNGIPEKVGRAKKEGVDIISCTISPF